jgi:hypothetical protein
LVTAPDSPGVFSTIEKSAENPQPRDLASIALGVEHSDGFGLVVAVESQGAAGLSAIVALPPAEHEAADLCAFFVEEDLSGRPVARRSEGLAKNGAVSLPIFIRDDQPKAAVSSHDVDALDIELLKARCGRRLPARRQTQRAQ